jgi:hypothetical protein
MMDTKGILESYEIRSQAASRDKLHFRHCFDIFNTRREC